MIQKISRKLIKIKGFLFLNIIIIFLSIILSTIWYKRGYKKGYNKGKGIGIQQGKDKLLLEIREALVNCNKQKNHFVLIPIENGIRFICGEVSINIDKEDLENLELENQLKNSKGEI